MKRRFGQNLICYQIFYILFHVEQFVIFATKIKKIRFFGHFTKNELIFLI